MTDDDDLFFAAPRQPRKEGSGGDDDLFGEFSTDLEPTATDDNDLFGEFDFEPPAELPQADAAFDLFDGIEDDYSKGMGKPKTDPLYAAPDWLNSLEEGNTPTEPAPNTNEAWWDGDAAEPEAIRPPDSGWLSEYASDSGSGFVTDGPPVYVPPRGVTPLNDPLAGDVDFDKLFDSPISDTAADQRESAARAPRARTDVRPFIEEELAAAAPDFLDTLQPNISDVSAGALVRQRQDRPEGELDERLKKLRRRGEDIPSQTAAATDDSLSNMLPGVADTLAPAPLRPMRKRGDEAGLAISADQQKRVQLLQSLVASTTRGAIAEGESVERLSAIELTYDSLEFAGLEAADDTARETVGTSSEAPAVPRRRAQTRRRTRPQLDRFFIIFLLFMAMLLPFYLPLLRVGDLPPASFAVGGRAEAAYTRIERIVPGTVVLVASEYSPAAAPELDTLTRAILRHLFGRGAYPVLISGDAIATLRTQTVIDTLNEDAAFLSALQRPDGLRADEDYFPARYLPGGALGLRAFSENTAARFFNEVRGSTALNLRTPGDLGLVVVIADRAEIVRNYAEQIVPLINAPLVVAVSYSAAPLVEPYIESNLEGLGGLLIGYGDGYTYETLLGIGDPETTLAPEAFIAGERPAPILATLTPTPIFTPSPTSTRSPDTATPRATRTPSATPIPASFAIVTGSQAVNVRPEPNTNNTPITQLSPGDRAGVIAVNDAGDWVNVQLEDGTEGWISASLVRIEATGSGVPKLSGGNKGGRRLQQPEGEDLTPNAATRAAQSLQTGEEDTPTPNAATRAARSLQNLTPSATLPPTNSPTIVATATPTATRTLTSSPEPTNTQRSTQSAADTETPTRTPSRTPVSTEVPPTQRSSIEPTPMVTSINTQAGVTNSPTRRATLAATAETTTEATLEAAMEITEEMTPQVIVGSIGLPTFTIDYSPSPGYREERWYAMTLGIMVSIIVITVGMVINIGRSLLRRRG